MRLINNQPMANDLVMQHFLLGVILNMLFLHILIFLQSIIFGYDQNSNCQKTNQILKLILWSRGYETFFRLNSTEHEIKTAHKN